MHVYTELPLADVGAVQRAMDAVGYFGISHVESRNDGSSFLSRALLVYRTGPALRAAIEVELQKIDPTIKLPRMFLSK
jgi:hypothetical protein